MEFTPHDPIPKMLTEREVALNAIVDLHFPNREKYDQRQLFASDIPQHDVHYTFSAPGDSEVIARYSGFVHSDEGDEILTP